MEHLEHNGGQDESTANAANGKIRLVPAPAMAEKRAQNADIFQPMIGDLNPDHLANAALALVLGLLVGIQRGWVLRDKPDGTRFAGIRTFGLLGLAGGITGVLYHHAAGPATVLMAAAALLVLYGYWHNGTSSFKASGTASMIALLTLACGFLAGSGERLLGSVITVTMVLLLSLRVQLHGWVKNLTETEVIAIARFALIAMVILPLLPDRGIGPYDAWNPRQLWMVVVMVCGFSFAGYFAEKRLGASRANIATAIAGAVVSSTAVTASMATRMRDGEGDPLILAAAVSAASITMFLRVLILVAVLAGFALPWLALMIVPAILASLAATLWYLRIADKETAQRPSNMNLRNPFDIIPALVLTVLVMVLTVIAHWVLDRFGSHGLALVLAISGTVDVDSAIITMGGLPQNTLDARLAGAVLAVPVTLNTLFKGGVAISIAGWRKGKLAALPLFASALATGGAYLLIP